MSRSKIDRMRYLEIRRYERRCANPSRAVWTWDGSGQTNARLQRAVIH